MGWVAGAEFVVLLPEATPSLAQELGARQVEAVRCIALPGIDHDHCVTDSVGGARLQAGETLDALLSQTHNMLSVAKRFGRDRVKFDETWPLGRHLLKNAGF